MWFLLLFGHVLGQQITGFDFLGPFLIGKTEIDADPVRSPTHNCTLEEILSKHEGCPTRFPSEVAPGGYATWMPFPKEGVLPVSMRAHQAGIVQALNKLAVLEFSGWATTVFTVPTLETYRIQCQPCHTVYVDGVRYEEDVYARGLATIGLSLSPGEHTLWVRVRARHNFNFSCFLIVAANRYVLTGPIGQVSDIVNGRLPLVNMSYVAFNFQNLSPEKLHVISVNVDGGDEATAQKLGLPRAVVAVGVGGKHLNTTNYYAKFIAPFHSVILPIAFEMNHSTASPDWWKRAVSSELPCLSFTVTVVAVGGGKVITSNAQRVALRCRSSRQSIVFTFMDADGSVTNAAFIRPLSPCPPGGCPVVMSLCGVGTTARSQADSHKYATKGSFVFGYPQAWVLVPFREGAHNGEGSGFWGPFVALRYLRQHASSTYRPDITRVAYTGHSRGGHWAYTLSQHSPYNAIAVMSASGYGDREDYGDANLMLEMDLQLSFMEPIAQAVLEAAIHDHDNHAAASNLKGVDVLVRVGSGDRTVPPFHQRKMFRVMHHAGVNVTYDEVPNKEHWWWDTESTSDGGVMNDITVRSFLEHHFERSAPLQRCVLDSSLADFVLTTQNPATQGCKGGVTILQMYSRLAKSTLRVHLNSEGVWELFPVNVRRFRMEAVEEVLAIQIGDFQAPLVNYEEFCHSSTSGLWGVCTDIQSLEERPAVTEVPVAASITGTVNVSHYMWKERSSITYGPARQVFSNPFAIVVGTLNPHALPRLMEVARGLSMGLHHSSLSTAPVLLDTELTTDTWQRKPVSLILVGGPSLNSWSRLAVSLGLQVPVRFGVNDSTIGVMGCHWTSAAIGFTFPLGQSEGQLSAARPHLSFMLAATAGDLERPSTEALLLAITSNTFSTNLPLTRAPFSNLFPDWMVANDAFASEGYGGVHGMGFWNNLWQHDASNGYLDPVCEVSPSDHSCRA